jgi:hypothetical protein
MRSAPQLPPDYIPVGDNLWLYSRSGELVRIRNGKIVLAGLPPVLPAPASAAHALLPQGQQQQSFFLPPCKSPLLFQSRTSLTLARQTECRWATQWVCRHNSMLCQTVSWRPPGACNTLLTLHRNAVGAHHGCACHVHAPNGYGHVGARAQ